MKKISFLIGLVVITLSSFAQVGINTTAPDSSAVLDLNANNKGLLIPTMTTTQREAMQASPPATGLADGLLVYDIDYKRFYFWDTNVSKWVVLNNWRKEYTSNATDDEHVSIVLENNSSVGIGQSSPNSKLTVNGNLSVGNTNTGAPANGAYIDGQVRIGSGAGTTEKLEVDGNSMITGTVTANEFKGFGITPIGGIIMYSGIVDATLFDASGNGVVGSKMDGWAICNGNNTTPNLVDRFVVGAGRNNQDANLETNRIYDVTNTGGENLHELTVDEMPSHNHGVTATASSSTTGIKLQIEGGSNSGSSNEIDEANGNPNSYWSSAYVSDPGHSHTITVTNHDRGSNQKHENRPPYYAVYYIMRTQ